MEKKSLEEVREFSPERFTKRMLFQKGESAAFVLNFVQGQALPPHKHPGTDLYLVVLEGTGTITVDGVDTEVSAQDTIWCGGDELFSFSNTGTEPARLYVVLSKVPSKKYVQDV